MKQVLILLVLATALAGGMFVVMWSTRQEEPADRMPAQAAGRQTPATVNRNQSVPDKAVLDISVHTLDELRVLLDRAEQLSSRLLDTNERASVVLVLHGPEVEYFSSKNYDLYQDVVNQAAQLDALDIVDVKICQTMMSIKGIARDDIPAFIDQVPDGRVEVERLLDGGYVYF